MKRTVGLLRTYAGAGSVLLSLPLFLLAGCSGGSEVGANAGARYGMERSEYISLKEAAKDPGDFQKAIMKKKIAKLQAQGVVVETAPSGKTTKKRR